MEPYLASALSIAVVTLLGLATHAFRSQKADNKEIIGKLDAVKDAGAAQSATMGRLEEKFNGLDKRVDEIHRRRNVEHERLLVVAADAIIELRAERRGEQGDRRHA